MATAKKTGRKTSGGKTRGRKGDARKSGGAARPRKAAAPRKTGSKAAPKAPTRRPRRSPKARLTEFLERAERTFGPVRPPETGSVLEKAVYLILRERGTHQTALRALKALREDFVDWNEVRVSRPTELARLMSGSSKGSSIRRFEARARRVGEMIDQIYNDRNEPSLEFLLEASPKDQLEYLEDLDDLGIHNAYALVQWLGGDEKLVLTSSELAKAAEKIGLTGSAAVTKVRKELMELVPPEQLVATQAHLNQLGNLETDEWPAALKELLD